MNVMYFDVFFVVVMKKIKKIYGEGQMTYLDDCGENVYNALACFGFFLASISCFFLSDSASRLCCSASWEEQKY
jgi:hypothetical protein